MVRMEHEFCRDALEQFEFYLQRGFAWCQPCAVAQAKDVCIHGHGGLAESNVQNDVGCFASHAWQTFQSFSVGRNLALVSVKQDAAGLQDVLGLAAKQANGFDVAFQPFLPQVQQGLRRVGYREQGGRGLVHADVGGLRAQDDGDQQLEGGAVFQLAAWLGVGCLQGLKKTDDLFFFHMNGIVHDRERTRWRP